MVGARVGNAGPEAANAFLQVTWNHGQDRTSWKTPSRPPHG